jgi:MFS family permease
MPTLPPRLGKYAIGERLREDGGMGALWRAHDTVLHRPVVVKMVRADIDTPELRERFEREALMLSSLQHPHIVTVFDYGEVEGHPYLVMEFIEGESLAELITRRPVLPIAEKLRILDDLCAAVAYAHRRKLVHRDLKPANVMIDAETGTVKLLDFGIARRVETGVSQFTQGVGTPCYMAPEQVQNGPIDARTDIFALGAIAYELFSYRRAFDAETLIALARQIVDEPPTPLAQICHDLPPTVVQAINQALAKAPARRPDTVESLRTALVGASASKSNILRAGLSGDGIRAGSRLLIGGCLALLSAGFTMSPITGWHGFYASVVYCVSLPLAGILSDWLGTRAVARFGTCAIVTSLLAFPISKVAWPDQPDSFILFLVAAVGAGNALTVATVNVLICRVRRHARLSGLALVHGCYWGGAVVGSLTTDLFRPAADGLAYPWAPFVWPAPWSWLLAAPAAGSAVLLWTQPRSEAAGLHVDTTRFLSDIKSPVIVSTAVAALFVAAYEGAPPWFLVQAIGYSHDVLLCAFGACIALSRLLLSVWSPLRGVPALAIAGLAIGIGFVGAAFSRPDTLPSVTVLSSVLFAVGIGVWCPLLLDLLAERYQSAFALAVGSMFYVAVVDTLPFWMDVITQEPQAALKRLSAPLSVAVALIVGLGWQLRKQSK